MTRGAFSARDRTIVGLCLAVAALLGSASATVAWGLDASPSSVLEAGGWTLVGVLPLLGADLLALRTRRFTGATGAVAGCVVAAATVVLLAAGLAWSTGLDPFAGMPTLFALRGYAVPTALLVLVGLVAGVIAERGPATVAAEPS